LLSILLLLAVQLLLLAVYLPLLAVQLLLFTILTQLLLPHFLEVLTLWLSFQPLLLTVLALLLSVVFLSSFPGGCFSLSCSQLALLLSVQPLLFAVQLSGSLFQPLQLTVDSASFCSDSHVVLSCFPGGCFSLSCSLFWLFFSLFRLYFLLSSFPGGCSSLSSLLLAQLLSV
jgi:hypothetical protein